MTTERITITAVPVQITDGTYSAHVTLRNGAFEYADSEESTAWHPAGQTINVSPPVRLFIRAAIDSGAELTAIVTTF